MAGEATRVERLEVDARREHALQSVTAGLSSAATRAEILRAFLDEGSRALETSAAMAYVLSADRQTLTSVAHRGVSDALAQAFSSVPIASNFPAARSVREGRPVWLASPETLEADFPEFTGAVRDGFERKALVALPLRVHGEAVAGIGFAFPETHAFDEGERTFLTTLAARCESALERARLYEESQEARAAAEHSRAEAETLLRFNEVVSGILAHDLRNPLAAILMNARLLKNDVSPERARTIGTRIVSSGERMSRMIDQILDWARARTGAGTIQLERTPCDLRAVADNILAELNAGKGDAPVRLETRGELHGQWDADRLAQVLSNLVANGLEHATTPGVVVSLDGADDAVRITVENEGQIEADLLPVMFEPFRGRASGSKARGRGLGLGLYIARQIVLAHGGTLALTRGAPGEQTGTPSRVAFTVTLPRTAA
jgi:signal transduction histidine kinase